MTPIPKPRPKLLDKRQAKADVLAEDRRENAKVKVRSNGQCEVREVLDRGSALQFARFLICHRRAGHIHHLRSGIGIRNRGASILAVCKLHVCEMHHEEIHGHVLKPESEAYRYDANRIRFTRIK